MIIPDVNLLVYAYNAGAPHHQAAKEWWEDLLSGTTPVGLPWAVSMGFLRLMTHRRVLARPLPPTEALAHIRSWFEVPSVQIKEPGSRHLDILDEMLGKLGIAGSLTTDAHLAAIAIEHQAELHSNDADFARFSGLNWVNPLG